MKIRNGFVSNSSSSSFVCLVTGTVESGWDASPEDVGFMVCEEGHEFLQQYVVGDPYDDPEYDGDSYNLPKKYCPICTLTHINSDDMLEYLLKTNNLINEDVAKEIRSKYTDYDTFRESFK